MKGRQKITISRPELVMVCKELNIDYEELTLEELNDIVSEEIKERFGGLQRKDKIPAEEMSENLRKFLTQHKGFMILDRNGNEYNYKFEEI